MGRMDKKQWIRSTLAHVQPAQVPYHFMFTPPVEAKLKAYYGTEDVARVLGFPVFLNGCKDKPQSENQAQRRKGREGTKKIEAVFA